MTYAQMIKTLSETAVKSGVPLALVNLKGNKYAVYALGEIGPSEEIVLVSDAKGTVSIPPRS